MAVLLDIDRLKDVFADLELAHPHFSDTPQVAFLNRLTGAVVRPSSEDELETCQSNIDFVSFPKPDQDSLDRYGQVLDFIESLEDGVLRLQLDQLVTGRGAIRRFKEYLYTTEGAPTKGKWDQYEDNRRYYQLTDWLSELGIDWVNEPSI